jgi:hypothetical protein
MINLETEKVDFQTTGIRVPRKNTRKAAERERAPMLWLLAALALSVPPLARAQRVRGE